MESMICISGSVGGRSWGLEERSSDTEASEPAAGRVGRLVEKGVKADEEAEEGVPPKREPAKGNRDGLIKLV